MSETRNIVVLGASFSGIYTTQYIMRHILPGLKSKHADAKYHVYIVNPSSDAYFRIASPRAAASSSRLAAEDIFVDLNKVFQEFAGKEFTFIQAWATGLDTAARTVSYKKSDYLEEEKLPYHALIVATGTKTYEPAFSQHSTKAATIDALKTMNKKVASAKDIVIAGGGPTAVEAAGEIAEQVNGKPGWFSTPTRKANITLVTGDRQLLPVLRPAIGKQAEERLKKLGVDVLYQSRVTDTTANGERTVVTLAKGDHLEADLYIAAYGVLPNTSFLPDNLLNDAGYLKTNPQTLRVDDAGSRIYAIGDVGSYSRNSILDVYDALPVLAVNLKRDLFSFNPQAPNEPPKGKDRLYVPNTKETQLVPIGTSGGVGAIMGYKLPSFFVWLIKGRDFFVGMSIPGLHKGDKVLKEVPWTAEEAVA